jgi:hypothetical protein
LGGRILNSYLSSFSQGIPLGGSALTTTIVVWIFEEQKSTFSVSETTVLAPTSKVVVASNAIKFLVREFLVLVTSVISIEMSPTFSRA